MGLTSQAMRIDARRRATALVLVLFLVAAACGGGDPVYEVSPEQVRSELALPDPTPAVPAFVVEAPERFTPDQLASLQAVDGAAVVAPVSLRWLRISGSDSDVGIRLGAVEPLVFRPVAPAETRDADFVWLSMLTGSAVLTHDAAERLGVGGRQKPDLGALNVGALADHAYPNLADALVDKDSFRPESWGAPQVAVVGARSGVTLQKLGADLRAAAPDSTVKRMKPPNVRQPGLPQPYVAPPSSTTGVAGLHPALAESVQRLIAAAKGGIWVVSGFRTTARQYELWIGALQKYGDPDIADNWVAPPGHSFHERGLAVDLGGDVELAARLAIEMKLPIWRPMSWEPWHFELVGSRG